MLTRGDGKVASMQLGVPLSQVPLAARGCWIALGVRSNTKQIFLCLILFRFFAVQLYGGLGVCSSIFLAVTRLCVDKVNVASRRSESSYGYSSSRSNGGSDIAMTRQGGGAVDSDDEAMLSEEEDFMRPDDEENRDYDQHESVPLLKRQKSRR